MNACVNRRRKAIYMILSVVLCALAMSLVDAVVKPQYFVKSMIKMILFLMVPFFYFLVNRAELKEVKRLFCIKGKELRKAFFWGIFVYGFIFFAYLLLRPVFDFSGIVGKLTADTGVSAENFVFVSLYISLINSFLEEIFFRGFGFLMLKRVVSAPFAFFFSALLFALYHAGMTMGYFHIGVFLLTLFGLFVAGMLFNFLDFKSESIYPSWLTHMFTNFAINTVGFILFGILPI